MASRRGIHGRWEQRARIRNERGEGPYFYVNQGPRPIVGRVKANPGVDADAATEKAKTYPWFRLTVGRPVLAIGSGWWVFYGAYS